MKHECNTGNRYTSVQWADPPSSQEKFLKMDTKILDYIDFEKVNTLLEGFNQTTGFVTAILDLEGNVLSKSGWRQICTEFHRIHPETAKRCAISDTVLANKMSEGENYHFYKCLNGLVDVSVPIIIKGEHVANLFSGHFFFEEPDVSFFKKQAEIHDFEESSYLKALEKVPIISQEKVKTAMNFLLNMTEMISEITFQKLEQIELNEERKKNEEILRHSEEDLKESQRIAHVGSWRLDVLTNQVVWSDELYKMYGFDPSLPPPPYNEQHKIFTPESWESLSKALPETIKTGTSYELELETLRKDGSSGWMWVRGEVVRDVKGTVAGLRGAAQDITERKKIEELMISLERRNQALLDHSPVCHKIVDLDFNLQYMSASGFTMLKLDHNDDVYGKPYPFRFFPATFRNEMTKTIKKVKETGEMLTIEALTNDVEGNEVWLYSTLVPVLDEGEIDYITVVSHDVTQQRLDERDRKRLEEQLAQSQKMESIGNLAGGIAHDFNNLLYPIIGFAEMLKEDLPQDSPEHESAQEIFNAGRRGGELVKQILAFSRQTDHKPSPVRFQKILTEVLKLTRSTIPSDIEIHQDIQQDCGSVMAEATQLHQISMNLITNA